jgi:uncharacterized repeat protein (TIGR01451 family)
MRSHSDSRKRGLVVRAKLLSALVAGLVATLALWPGVASAALSISSATIDGSANSSYGPPGSVFPATVTGSATGGDTWAGTQYRFGSGNQVCVNTTDTGGTRTNDVDVTAPGDPGTYDLGFTARGTSTCGGAASSEKVLTNALRVTAPATNRDLPPLCGINVMLVLDESTSIQTSGATEKVKSATRAFLNALAGTGAKVSIVDFSTTAAQPVPYTTVTAATIASTFNPYLDTGYRPNGWTNWEAAFEKVRQSNDVGLKADLVVFITDGDPTAHNRAGSTPVTGLTEGDVTAMRPAAAQADLVKGQGSHIFALGVGAAVTGANSARRLTAISGFDQYPGTPFGEADYTLVQDFDQLAQALRQIVLELCQSSLTVTKQVDFGDGVFHPDAGWEFTASIDMSAGRFEWLQPPASGTGPQPQTTDADGVAKFQWKPTDATATSSVSVAETVKPGFDFVSGACTVNTISRGLRTARRVQLTQPALSVALHPGEYATCTVRNRIQPGTIEIRKQANPQGTQEFEFGGSLGPFTLVDDGGTAASKIFAGLAPGTYTVSETVPENWELTGITCFPASAATITGPEVSITLAPASAVVCTYGDERVTPPIPPEPTPEPPTPTPTPTPTPVPTPSPPESSSELPLTQLRIVKTQARVARVGARVPFRVTVTNTGPIAATDVRVADVPPAALTLTGLRAANVRVVRGVAVWRVGTLAPGASRTVTGSVRIAAGTPGLKRNHAYATAINANLVINRADTRVLAQRRQAPSFTG